MHPLQPRRSRPNRVNSSSGTASTSSLTSPTCPGVKVSRSRLHINNPYLVDQSRKEKHYNTNLSSLKDTFNDILPILIHRDTDCSGFLLETRLHPSDAKQGSERILAAVKATPMAHGRPVFENKDDRRRSFSSKLHWRKSWHETEGAQYLLQAF